MARVTVVGGLAAVLATVVLAGCSAQLGDRGGEEGSPPDRIGDVDYIEVFRNADNFPNIARICVDGVAFAGTSSGLRGENAVASPALLRIPEWDQHCVGRTYTPPPPDGE